MTRKSIDKRSWGHGPWEFEPDYVEFKHCGFRCILLRFEHTGVWNGYVEVSDLHPWFYQEVESNIHGGITWRGPIDEIEAIPNCKFVGFDCAHGFDLIPAMAKFMDLRKNPFYQEYRTIEYATREVKKLANQACQAGVFVNNQALNLGLNPFENIEISMEREFQAPEYFNGT